MPWGDSDLAGGGHSSPGEAAGALCLQVGRLPAALFCERVDVVGPLVLVKVALPGDASLLQQHHSVSAQLVSLPQGLQTFDVPDKSDC